METTDQFLKRINRLFNLVIGLLVFIMLLALFNIYWLLVMYGYVSNPFEHILEALCSSGRVIMSSLNGLYKSLI